VPVHRQKIVQVNPLECVPSMEANESYAIGSAQPAQPFRLHLQVRCCLGQSEHITDRRWFVSSDQIP
jgi:hypothetical protein